MRICISERLQWVVAVRGYDESGIVAASECDESGFVAVSVGVVNQSL